MKKRLLGLAALVITAVLGSGSAIAEPYLAVVTGLKCGGCHVNPTGGGMRNAFGTIYGQTQMPARLLDMSSTPWTGDLGRYIGIGANLRGGATFINFPGGPSISSFDLTSLRAYVDLRVIPDRLSLYIDERLAPGDANNAETYLRLWSKDHRFYVKAGQMYLPFGIRLQDDSAFTREPTSINFNTPDRGVEIGFEGGPWTAQLAVSNGTSGGPEVDDGKQWSLRAEYVSSRWRAGASFNLNDFDTGSRRMQNVFAGLRTGKIAWLGEVDYIVDTTSPQRRTQVAGLLEANWNVRKGHNLKFTAEHFDPNRNAAQDRQTRLSFVYEYTLIPFLQLRTGIRNYDDVNEVPFLNQRIVFVQLHGFL
ncbi:MAG: hypothetical protein IT482_15380 [Gammaproteobacteria bacterium]|nr:hypothetical protein [Gammaproteobacteria bacterium]